MPDAREIAVAAVQPFIAGMIAGTIATCVTQPVDFLKTQLQLSGEGTRAGLRPSAFQVARSILAAQGIAVFYTGLGAALARQVLYGSARLGLFRVFSDALKARYFAADALPVSLKVGAALAAGAIAALVGNPADLVLVRMQADSALPPEAQRRYRGVFDAVSRIVREEGVLALWRGAAPTVLRAMAMNVGMLATADQAKEAFAPALGGVDSIATLLASSAVAGVTASFASLPFDMVKTRLQKQQPLPDGSLPYRGVVDCAVQIAGKEGPLAFFKVRRRPCSTEPLVHSDHPHPVLFFLATRAPPGSRHVRPAHRPALLHRAGRLGLRQRRD